MAHQFVGYELGNLNVAIAGAGGYKPFARQISDAFSSSLGVSDKLQTLVCSYPDAAVVLGMGAVVLAAPFVQRAGRAISSRGRNMADFGVAGSAAVVMGGSVYLGASLLSVSASSFVTGSALLVYADRNPLALKGGAIFLGVGAGCLAGFGAQEVVNAFSTKPILDALLPALTMATGLYVGVASSMTYAGGIYETQHWRPKETDDGRPLSHFQRWFHPKESRLAEFFLRVLDDKVLAFNHLASRTLLRFIPEKVRNEKPFATSMWARLPWRIVTGIMAFSSGYGSFGLSNLFWAYGDFNIGLRDYLKKSKT